MLCSKSERHHLNAKPVARTNTMAPPVNLAFHVPKEENWMLVSRNNKYLHSQEQLWTSALCQHAGLLTDTGMEGARLQTPKVDTQRFMEMDKDSLGEILPHGKQMNGEEIFSPIRPTVKI